MGVGYFTKVSERHGEFWRYVVCHALRPRDLRPGNSQPNDYVPWQDAWPRRFLHNAGFSGDRRHFALSRWGLALLMGRGAVACAAACGSAHICKLKVCHLRLVHCRMQYATSTLLTSLGPLK